MHKWRLIIVAVSVVAVLGIVTSGVIVSFIGYPHEVHEVVLRVDGNRNAYSKPTINVSAGSEVRIIFVNSARLKAHNWVMGRESVLMDDLARSGHDSGSREFLPDESLVHAATSLVAPRDRVTIKFDAPQASGEYVFLCTVPGHSESGMHGTVIVSE